MATESLQNIIHLVSNKEWGGGEQYAYDLCSRLKSDGYSVTVVCRSIYCIKRKFIRIVPVHCTPLKGFVDFRSIWVLKRLLKNGKNCIHVHNFKDAFTAVCAKKLANNNNVRIVVTRHLVRKGKTSWIYRWIYKNVNSIIFVSDLSKREFMKTSPKIDKSKLKIVHNSIVMPQDVEQLPDLRQTYSLNPTDIIVMFHGRLAEEKGVSQLIDAMDMVEDERVFLFILGAGRTEYETHLRQMIDKLGLSRRIFMLGFRSNVFQFISQSDIGVVPTIAQEAFSLSSLEYLSVEKPVIATNNGAQVEFLSDRENAVLVPPNDAKALANAIGMLAQNPDVRKTLGENGERLYREKMSYDIFYSKIKDIYNATEQS